MFRFSDTVISPRRSLSDFIRDQTAGNGSRGDSEDGSDGGGTRGAEGEEVGWLREED